MKENTKKTRKRSVYKKFTLIELLIVVAIIGILVSILLPSLGRAREMSKRSVCLSNLKQVHTASSIYAMRNKSRLVPQDYNLHRLSKENQQLFEPYMDSWLITDCSNYPYKTIGKGDVNPSAYSDPTGFIYSGGINTSSLSGPGESWESPKLITDDGNLMLWADKVQTSGNYSTLIPHTNSGYRNLGAVGFGIDLKAKGSQGANRLLLNGSASWAAQSTMTGQKGETAGKITFWWKVE